MNDTSHWSAPVRVEDVPEEGCELTLTADPATREALARTAGVIGVPRLEARFRLDRHGKGGLHVTGTVSASVEQTCVVTLDPLTNEVSEAVDIVFDPAAPDAPLSGDEEAVLADAADPPEPLVGDAVDLGALAADFLLLGIDPYPRKPGATFSPPASAEDAAAHPFAALAALKKKPSGQR
jgi:hypothetical protein